MVSRLGASKGTDDVSIASVSLCPGFFEDRYPDLIFVGLAEDRLSSLVNWYIVVNKDLLYDSVDSEGDPKDAIFDSLLLSEDGSDALFTFGQCGDCGEEVAVTECALDDILGLYFSIEEDGICDDFGESFPFCDDNAFYFSKTVVVGWKLVIVPHLRGVSILLDEVMIW